MDFDFHCGIGAISLSVQEKDFVRKICLQWVEKQWDAL